MKHPICAVVALFPPMLLTAACASKPAALRDILPSQIQRAWTLEETRVLDPTQAPANLRNLTQPKQALQAVYKHGERRLTLAVYDMGAETLAFEGMQRWRQTEALAFYRRQYFFVLPANSLDNETLSSFAAAMQQAIP